MMDKIKLFLAIVIVVFSGTLISAAQQPTVAQTIEKMPANTVAEDNVLSAQLVATGADGIMDVCKMLIAPGKGDDTKARYALATLTRYTARPDSVAEKRMYEKVVLKAIASADDSNVKAFLVRQIELVGTDESVETLAAMLSDTDLADSAAQALVSIGTPFAETALLDAFAGPTDDNLVTLIKSLGDLRCKPAADQMLQYVNSRDQQIRLTAIYALANIAPPAKKYFRTTKAACLLEEATHAESLYERSHALSNYLLYAQRLAEQDENSAALKICREVLQSQTAKDDNNVVCKALSIIVDIEKANALADLLAAMDSENEYLYGAAVKLAGKIPGKDATAKWVGKLSTVTPTAKIKIIGMLATRGDKTALPVLTSALKDTDINVRLAAIPAIARLGDKDAVNPLLASLKAAKGEDLKVIQAALMTLPSDPLFNKAGASLVNLPAASRVAVLEILADRNAASQLGAVIDQTIFEDEMVRVAAIKSLGKLVSTDDLPLLIDIMLNAETSRQRSEASRVVVRLCLRNNNVEARAKPLLAAMENASTEQKVSIVKILPAIGGKQALEVIVSGTKSSAPELSDAAIRSLTKWKGTEALGTLLEVAETTKKTNYNVMALKAYVNIVAGSELSTERKVNHFEKAMSIARRQDEKKYILSRLARIRSAIALEFAVRLLGDKEIASQATTAVVNIALPNDENDGLSGPGVGGLLLEAYPVIADEAIRKRIDGYVRNMPRSVGGNLALNKPVTISCNVQRGHKSEFAVDGQMADKNVSYWGNRWPSWIQVDLQEVVPVESVDLWFYWGDGRYYQYTVEVSTDGKAFTQVVDQSKNTVAATPNGVTHQFNAVDARYVRVNILKNSDNEAVHLVELEVHAKNSSNVDILSSMVVPEGFRPLFNGRDLSGWKGLLKGPYDNPIKRGKLNDKDYKEQQVKADDLMRKHWHVVDGVLYFDGGGFSLATDREYGDFEMLVDWKLMHDRGDSGIYLRGTPQVQIWDPAQHKIGSGGLYNNKKNPSKPTEIADNPIGQWNTFRIKMVGEKVTVHLNDKLVVDNVTLENYWDRNQLIFSREQIELQCHGNPVCFRNIFIREIPRPGEFVSLFNGRDHTGWVGDIKGYPVENNALVCRKGGNIFTEKEYSDFVLRFEFKLSAGTNNGLGIRTPLKGNAAYAGMELQVLDNTADKYKNLKDYQYHGSIYGVVRADPTKRGILKPLGEWNTQEVIAKGDQITVILNGETIVDANIIEASTPKTKDGKAHPGLKNRSGHIGFLGHGSRVEFRKISIKELN